MESDIVARLLDEHHKFSVVPSNNKLQMSPETIKRIASLWRIAADEIERLRARVAELEAERPS